MQTSSTPAPSPAAGGVETTKTFEVAQYAITGPGATINKMVAKTSDLPVWVDIPLVYAAGAITPPADRNCTEVTALFNATTKTHVWRCRFSAASTTVTFTSCEWPPAVLQIFRTAQEHAPCHSAADNPPTHTNPAALPTPRSLRHHC